MTTVAWCFLSVILTLLAGIVVVNVFGRAEARERHVELVSLLARKVVALERIATAAETWQRRYTRRRGKVEQVGKDEA